jgi:predicted DNA-binding transcriptional regulator AlpA
MNTDKLSFNDIPDAISELNRKIDLLLQQSQVKQTEDPDKLLDLNQLIEYLPEKPAKQTIYGKINDRRIPYEKHGKKLYFRKSVIDSWLNNGRRVS